MAKSINRYFQFLASSKEVRPSDKLCYPSADVYQTPDGWLVKVELAGVSAEDIEIDIQGNLLYIAGTRRDKTCAVGVSYHQMEITYSRFHKQLRFPCTIKDVSVERVSRHGLLVLHLRRQEDCEEGAASEAK